MTEIVNQFTQITISQDELDTISNEIDRLAELGYKVPSTVVIKPMNGISGLAVPFADKMYIHPITNLEQLRFTVAHEIGHFNEPKVEFDIWADSSNELQDREDFADWFANNI